MAGTPPGLRHLFDHRVLVVSGKGGTGKTVVAAACARAAATDHRNVILTEIEGRNGLSHLLGTPPPGFEERRTRFGHALLSITAKEALLEYLTIFTHMKTLARSLNRARVVEVATEAIPGFRDVMVAGKLYELTDFREGSGSGRGLTPYDFVVVDAPPTGQLLPFMESASAYRELVRGGRANRQLGGIDRLLREHTRVALVTVAEEMSVVETLEAVEALREAKFVEPVIVVNQLTPQPFPKGTRAAALRLDGPLVASIVREAGIDVDDDDAEELVITLHELDTRLREERRHVTRLAKVAPVVELPFLFTPAFGAAEVETLSEHLTEERAA
jgi:anion-transporting  ArsA/GET3 family ATPase